MKRRRFLVSSAAMAFGGGLFARSSTALADSSVAIDVIAELKKLRISAGPYAGGFHTIPDGPLNWYFANLALLPILQFLSPADLNTFALGYVNLYLANLDQQSTISDVLFPYGANRPDMFTLVGSDSDDAYAGTFLSLATRYLRISQNWAWWNANRATLKEIAYRNLALMQKPSGMTCVFQAPRNELDSLGYLMDNCEAYRGLRDFASLLRDRGEPDEANYYDLVASGIAAGISIWLYDGAHAGFRATDGDVAATTSFYPGITCQVFPQAFGLIELTPYFDACWNYLNRYAPKWPDGHYDFYPWAILGFVASKRGQSSAARAQLRSIESSFANERARVTINELGFYQRTKNLLSGRPDI